VAAIPTGHTVTTERRNDAACVLAEAVRTACVETALLAYEDAGLRGLCQEGRWEHALAAIRRLDLRKMTSPDAS
jgi:pentatricopeptide repeat protein